MAARSRDGALRGGLRLKRGRLGGTAEADQRRSERDRPAVKGQVLLRQGVSEAPEELYRKALSVAEEQEAKLWELRAAATLARRRGDQCRHAEARDLFAPVYDWFTEGFDTPDLKT